MVGGAELEHEFNLLVACAWLDRVSPALVHVQEARFRHAEHGWVVDLRWEPASFGVVAVRARCLNAAGVEMSLPAPWRALLMFWCWRRNDWVAAGWRLGRRQWVELLWCMGVGMRDRR